MRYLYTSPRSVAAQWVLQRYLSILREKRNGNEACPKDRRLQNIFAGRQSLRSSERARQAC